MHFVKNHINDSLNCAMYVSYIPYVPKVPQFLISESMYIMRFLHPIILRHSTIGSNHFWWTSFLSMHLHFLLFICKSKNLWNITLGRKYRTYQLFENGFGSLSVANYKVLVGLSKNDLNKQQPPIRHYRLWSFQERDTKLKRFLPKNNQRKFLNFDNWTNGEPQ